MKLEKAIHYREGKINKIKKTKLIFYVIMSLVLSLVVFLINKIWNIDDDMTWYNYVFAGPAFLVMISLYIYLYKEFLRSRHKALYLILFISFVLFKLLPYILGWKKF